MQVKKRNPATGRQLGYTRPRSRQNAISRLSIFSMQKNKKYPLYKRLYCIRYLSLYPSGSSTPLSRITPKWIEDFQYYMFNKTKLAQSSAQLYCMALRIALNQAVRDNILISNPANKVKLPSKPETNIVYLTQEEVQKLESTELKGNIAAEVRRAFLFGCYNGLRICDIQELRWKDIEPKEQRIIKRQKKTSRNVVIPLVERTKRYIDLEGVYKHNPDDKVFPLLVSRSTLLENLHRWFQDK